MFIGVVVLFKILLMFFIGGLIINIGGLIVMFVNVILLLDKWVLNGKFFKLCLVNFVFVVVISYVSIVLVIMI